MKPCLLFLSIPCLAAVLAGQSIHKAARDGDLARVRALVEKDPDLVNAQDGDKRLALHLAARYGHVRIVKYLIEKGADIDHAAYNKFTPLMLAATFNRRDVVSFLVDKGAKLELKSSFGATALEQAATHNHLAVVRDLASSGARYGLAAAASLGDVRGCKAALEKDPKATVEWKVMWEACRKGHADVVRLLLENGAPKFAQSMLVPRVPMLVPGLGHAEVVRALLEAGADVDPVIRNYKGVAPGTTPLLIASGRGYASTVDVLLKHKADLGATDDRGWTVMHEAAAGGHVELVKKFLELGVDPKKRAGGWTPMALAARRLTPRGKANARVRGLIALLAEHGVEVDLYTAISTGNEKRARALLAKDAQRPPQKQLDTALRRAVDFGYARLVDLLCERGASVEARRKGDRAPLHWAAYWNRAEVAKVLLARGADPNAKTNRDFTPLHEAARLGSLDVAKLLLAAGADPEAVDKAGKRPIDWAAGKDPKHVAVRALLSDRRGP